MPKLSSKPRRPRDANSLAFQIVQEATGDAPKQEPAEDQAAIIAKAIAEGKDPAAVLLGTRGGKKGGKARAANMSAKERSEAARKAAKARWDH